MKKFGHRNTLCGGLIFGGIASLVTGLVPDGNQQSINFSLFLLQSPSFVELDPPVIRIVFSLIGKFFITCVLAVNFSYTIELFPTSTRNAVVGLCSTMDKVGGILAPSLAGIVIKQLILTLQHISDEFFLGFFFLTISLRCCCFSRAEWWINPCRSSFSLLLTSSLVRCAWCCRKPVTRHCRPPSKKLKISKSQSLETINYYSRSQRID